MTRTPVEVPETLFGELRAQLGPAGLVELTAAIAWENYRARFNHAFGVEAEGYSEGGGVPAAAARYGGRHLGATRRRRPVASSFTSGASSVLWSHSLHVTSLCCWSSASQ